MNRQNDNQRMRLERLLGPSGHEVGCEECFELLDEYVELELDDQDADAKIPGLRAHLEGCPACHEEHEAMRELVGSARPRAEG